MHERMMAWPRLRKQLAVILMDVVLALLATWCAFSSSTATPSRT